MPDVYRVLCTNCSYAPPIGNDEIAGYVAIDGRDDGTVLPDG